MTDLESKDDEFGVEEFAQHAIVADAIPPDPGAIAAESFAPSAWVVQGGDLVEVIDDSTCDLTVELPELP